MRTIISTPRRLRTISLSQAEKFTASGARTAKHRGGKLPNPSPHYALLMKAVAPVVVGRVLLKFNRPSENITAELAVERAAVYSHTGHLYSVADEFSNMPESMRQLRESPMRLGAKPLVVLTRGRRPPASTPEEAERADRAWRELQADLMTGSSNGRHVIAEESCHYIQFDQPGLVIDLIYQVAGAAGREQNGPPAAACVELNRPRPIVLTGLYGAPSSR